MNSGLSRAEGRLDQRDNATRFEVRELIQLLGSPHSARKRSEPPDGTAAAALHASTEASGRNLASARGLRRHDAIFRQ
jgi:hypothetical protein